MKKCILHQVVCIICIALLSRDVLARITLIPSTNIQEHHLKKCAGLVQAAYPLIKSRILHVEKILDRFVEKKINIDIKIRFECKSFFPTHRSGYLIWRVTYVIMEKNDTVMIFKLPYFIFFGSEKYFKNVAKVFKIKRAVDQQTINSVNDFYLTVENWIVSYAKRYINVSKVVASTFYVQTGVAAKVELSTGDERVGFLGVGLKLNLNILRFRLGFDIHIGSEPSHFKNVQLDTNVYIGFMLSSYSLQSFSVYAEIGWSLQRRAIKSAIVSLEDLHGIIFAIDFNTIAQVTGKLKIGASVKPYIKVSKYSRGQFFSLTAVTLGISLGCIFNITS